MKIIIIGLIILMVLFVGGCAPKQVCREIQIPYDAQESYTEQEPYTDEECIIKDYSFSFKQTDRYKQGDRWYNMIEITNNEDEPGYFKYQNHFRTADGDYGCKSSYNNWPYYADSERWEKVKVYGKSSEIVQCNYEEQYPDEDVTIYLPKVIPPEKEVCEKFTNYRPVTKYRTVTRYKTETVCE